MPTKNKKKPNIQKAISLKNYIIEAARKLPIYKCLYMGEDEGGIKQIVVGRQKRNGQIIVGFYLVDMYCLGLKNTFYAEFSDSDEFDEKFDSMGENGHEFIEIEPNLAFNYIYGAIEYAEDIAFKPHKDFAITEYILDDVEKIAFIDIEFGQNGRPVFFQGPDDKPGQILAHLDKHVGKGNYEYVAMADDENFEGEDDDDNEDEYQGRYFDELEKYREMEPDAFNEVTASIINRLPENEKPAYIFVMLFASSTFDLFDDLELVVDYKKNSNQVLKKVYKYAKREVKELKDSDFEKYEYLLKIAIENVIKYDGYEFICLNEFVMALSLFENMENAIKNNFDHQKFIYYADFIVLFKDNFDINLVLLLQEITSVLYKDELYFELNIFNKNIVAKKALALIELAENEDELDEEWEQTIVAIDKHIELSDYLPEMTSQELLNTMINFKEPKMT
jgi:hypothetical protein